MTFTPKKYKDIYDEMRAMSQVVTDFEVGSVTRTIYESFSYELALMYEKMQMVYLSAYVDSAVGTQLDQVVAVLGITRSQPDFAEGIVSFQRDGAGPDITIPAGTLVATKESSTGEKFVYETGKEAVLAAVRTSVDVAIRAVERGDAHETAAGTIIVMPRPVPGIKSVINNDPIRLIGKRRETDNELRDRAKSTLISSGKATVLSIENTLLSLSGVRDARVRENFNFARADATITRGAVTPPGSPLIIPRGTRLLTQSSGGPPVSLPFRTMETVSFQASDGSGSTRQVRIEGLVEGKIGEIPTTTGISLTWHDAALAPLASILLNSPALLEDFGLIDVYVDAPRLTSGTAEERAAEADRLNTAIRSVRAAGIFAILRPAVKARLSAVFRVEIPASLNLSPEERRAFEESIEDTIAGYIGALRMGKPLLYGKLIKEVLSLENIDNLSDFRGKIIRNLENAEQTVPIAYSDSEKAIRVEEYERVEAAHICVATEDKALKLHIAFLSPDLESTPIEPNDITAISTYLADLAKGQPVVLDNLFVVINGITSIPNAETFQVRPETWCPGPTDDPRPLFFSEGGQDKIEVTFVEQPTLGSLFGYAKRLELAGALKLTLPLNISQADALAARQAVRTAIDKALDRLGAEEDVLFESLVAAALSVNQVLAAEIAHGDFIPYADGIPVPNIVDKQKIDVPPLRRAFAGHLLIQDSISHLDFTLVGLQVTTANLANAATIRAALLIAWNNILNGYLPGDKVAFTDLKSALENRVPGIPYTIQTLEISAFNEIDEFYQVRNLGDTSPFHTRSIELPKAGLLLSTTTVITIV